MGAPLQQYKSVYFADYPSIEAKRRSLTIAFGSDDAGLYKVVKGLSSEVIRQAMGSPNFGILSDQAETAGLSLNAFCLDQLRKAAEPENEGQMAFPGLGIGSELRVDPIQATFRGGKEKPLHDWYPYLEGYSPQFVESVIDTFAPSAKHILDPFAGSGTTPLTVARRGLVGTYCELNPVLQFLVEVKAEALALPANKRAALANLLRATGENLKKELSKHKPDHRLAKSYKATFGTSAFFPKETYDTVLRLRTWLDSLDYTAPEAAKIAAVAVVAALIPASNLIRRGDLRFRKGVKECGLRNEDIEDLICERLNSMSNDLEELESVEHCPLLVAGDAKRLDRCADLGVDAIITSPPYLNGTNYYRNTKVELWFLRALLSGRDLAAFREQTVTAGINDVTVKKNAVPVSPSVETIAHDIEHSAYDKRIPRMVVNYFSDMSLVIDGLAKHVDEGVPLLLDIGDSAYAGVHVDTPAILAEILEDKGWRVQHEVTLRQRLSRSGLQLRQVLLAAEAPKRARKTRQAAPKWKKQWKQFQTDLPHQKGAFAKRNWGSPLHSLCSYQGKMKPSLARHLVETFVPSGGRMVDPFGGVGTIPFEAASIGAETWSFDISPVAMPVAAAKLQPTTAKACNRVMKRLEAFIESETVTPEEKRAAAKIKFNGSLAKYFHRNTFEEILLARRFFQEQPADDAASYLVLSSLLHVLHGNRPYALSRRSHPITPFAPTGKAEDKKVIEKVRDKVERSLAVERPDEFVPGNSVFQDATGLWPVEVDALDAVITSPPFFDSTRFYSANWMRLWFAGWTAEDFKQQPFSFVDERQKVDFRVYEPILRQARERLKPGGVCVLHLGKSRKCDMAEQMVKIAKPWFAHAEVFRECVGHCESHGIRDKGTVVEHSYLVLY